LIRVAIDCLRYPIRSTIYYVEAALRAHRIDALSYGRFDGGLPGRDLFGCKAAIGDVAELRVNWRIAGHHARAGNPGIPLARRVDPVRTDAIASEENRAVSFRMARTSA